MNEDDILIKALEKARKNGYKPEYFYCANFERYESASSYCDRVIFSHAFAKAFWGQGPSCNCNKAGDPHEGSDLLSWQWHLTRMVLEEDPIKYLNQFL